MAVPKVDMFWTAGCSRSLAPYSLIAPITFGRSCSGGIFVLSMTIALTFFMPMTAPTPPRAAMRTGRFSASLTAMPASSPRYSPTGLHRATLVFLPYFSCSRAAASILPLPI